MTRFEDKYPDKPILEPLNSSQLEGVAGYMFESGKTYPHSIGLSCTFRQWRAQSHCRFLHGYALQVTLTFRSPTLDERNWVQDFGDLKPVKKWLEDNFDHKLVIARDDPKINFMMGSEFAEIAEITVLDHVGCEAFAKYIFDHVVKDYALLDYVEVREHEGNFARYRRAP